MSTEPDQTETNLEQILAIFAGNAPGASALLKMVRQERHDDEWAAFTASHEPLTS